MSFDLEGVFPYKVTVTAKPATTVAEVRALLEPVEGDGWICFTDRVERWTGGGELKGTPLSAELCLRDGGSLHLRQTGAGWVATTIAERALDGPPEASTTVGYVEELESSAPKGCFPDFADGAPPLRYRVYWQKDEDGVYRPWMARFLGWGER